ncbi:MAG TPA: hypothetical protein VFU22_31945 [Roseiflexaceae bacterium]|nr:hypothetical protein [Roseiflexaceae bacterium]
MPIAKVSPALKVSWLVSRMIGLVNGSVPAGATKKFWGAVNVLPS